MRARLLVRVAVVVAAASPADAQNLYTYVDENGVRVYTDRRPDSAREFEVVPLETRGANAEVRLFQRVDDDQSVVLVARNDYYAPIELAFELVAMDNLDARTPTSGMRVVPPRSELELLTLRRADPARPMRLEYAFRYLPGDPKARHAPAAPYRLPYAPAQAFEVSQSFPDAVTHKDTASRHAIDFVMPVGTGVYAAREGTVIDVAGDFFESGTDPVNDAARANRVRVLHADGTMALYAHLNWNSIRVVPGQQVARGQYLADSGNTGFSTGPHLHFVVQRNGGGALVSVPVRFAAADGGAVTLRTGQSVTAH